MKSVPMLKNVRDKQILNDIVNELEFMLPQEVDYEQELKNAEFFSEIVNPDHFVPKYYPQYCTKHVLCMDYIEGSFT